MAHIDNIRKGDTAIFKIDYGPGVDITGWIFYFILKKQFDDIPNYLQISTVAGDNALDDVENGLAYLTLETLDTVDLELGKYFYALKVDKGTEIRTLLPPISEPRDAVSVVEGIQIE